jgi:putative ATP-dependent endonuclease of OLD family
MEILNVQVENFKSVADAALEGCGRLNVLIGKNSSGKSSLLGAIDTLFHVVRAREPVCITPGTGGSELDYHQRQTGIPIRLAVELSLSDSESSNLIANIISESPQLKPAVEGLTGRNILTIRVLIASTPSAHGYVSNLLLRAVDSDQDVGEVNLFSLSPEVANEFYRRAYEATTNTHEIDQLETLGANVDDTEFRMSKSHNEGPFLPQYIISRYVQSTKLVSDLGPLFEKSESVSDFKDEIDRIITSIRTRIASAAEEPLPPGITTFGGEVDRIPSYVDEILDAVAGMTVLHLGESRRPVGREEAQELLSLKVSRGGTDRLLAVQKAVRDLLGVEIDAFQGEAGTGRRFGEPSAEMDVDDFVVEVNGSGIREALRLVLDCELNDPVVVLVEEPEVHLHPSLETSVMQYLKSLSQRCQLFVTTHSTNFLDTAEMKNVYLITKDGGTEVRVLDYEAAEAAIPSELGIRLSSVFMYDRLVFVEGPSDEVIIRQLAAQLGFNLSRPNVGFVPMGGVRNFGYFAVESTLDFLTNRRVESWFVLDRDEASEHEVETLLKRHRANTRLEVLGRREIENYLIEVGPLRDFLEFKRELSGLHSGHPTQEDVETALDETAEELKAFSLGKRIHRQLLQPVRPGSPDQLTSIEDIQAHVERQLASAEQELARRRWQTEIVFSSAVEALELDWESRKLHIVPGSELIDGVCQRFGIRFRKERDGGRLADQFTSESIPNELETLIRKLASDSGDSQSPNSVLDGSAPKA